jgi:hypothetical protein
MPNEALLIIWLVCGITVLMMARRRNHFPLVLVVLLMFLLPCLGSADSYMFFTLDVPQAMGYSVANGINSQGQVTGFYLDSQRGYQSFIYSEGAFTTLTNPLAIEGNYAQCINNSGTVVGSYSDGAGILHGFLFDGGTYSTIEPQGSGNSSHANGINDAGVVVGDYPLGTNPTQGYIKNGSVYTILSYPGAYTTVAHGINNAGQIVGNYQEAAPSLLYHGFLFNAGVYTQIDYPATPQAPVTGSHVFGINNNGQMVGTYSDSTSLGHGFVYSSGVYSTLDYPGARTTSLLSINDFGVIVGGYQDATGVHGFIATPTPELSLSSKSLTFGFSGTQVTSPQPITVSFTNRLIGSWTVTSNQPNITVRPSSGIGNGTFQIAVSPGASGVVTVTAPAAANSPQDVQVTVASVTRNSPFGSFDTPVNNAALISGAIAVTGWALDSIEVTSVGIYREPVGNEMTQTNGLVYVGNSTFVAGARPDVEATYPSAPLNYRAGWGYMLLTNLLPNSGGSPGPGNGPYKLHAIAINKTGQTSDLGTRGITVDNTHASKPFGTIDTPGQGDTISGNAYVNFGWALTQNPYCIPTDASTINAYIDSTAVGRPVYNQFRSDVATFFPGLCNTNGAVGFFYIDTTKFSNGVHTISWVVYDNQGRGDGIGSRYFTVLNSGTENEPLSAELTLLAGKEMVALRQGFDPNRDMEPLRPDASGAYSIETEELGRVEIQVGAMRGYLEVNGERRPLPIGSTLRSGVFYWQAGPGFLGDYPFVFQRPDRLQIRLRVHIGPRNNLQDNIR